MKGRKPKPAERRRREGNARQHAIPEEAKVGGRGAPPMPPGLPEEAKTAWRFVVGPLVGAKLLRQGDQFALESLCLAVGRMRQARKELNTYRGKHRTLMVEGSAGQLREHPALAIERAAMKEIGRWTERLGLDPVSRTRLGTGGERGATMDDDVQSKIGASPRLRAIDGGGA